MSWCRLYSFLIGILAFSTSVAAQDNPSPTDLVTRVESASHRLNEDIECATRKKREIDAVLTQMNEALARVRGAGEATTEARLQIARLEQRAALLEREALVCFRREPRLAVRELPAEPVRVEHVAPPPDPHVEAVAQENPATRVVERDVALGHGAHIVVGEQVDGTGRVDDSIVIAGMRNASARLGGCFQELSGSARRGELVLSFAIDAAGHVNRVTVEGDTLGVASVSRCVRNAGSTLRFSSGARGGDAVMSYTLRYSAE